LPRAGRVSRKEKIKLYRRAKAKIEAIARDFRKPLCGSGKSGKSARRRLSITSNFAKSRFCAIVDKAKEYIRKGEIIQVVLSQRFKTAFNKAPFDIYRALRSLNPSPYMFFLKLDGLVLIGSSPELLVRCEDGVVVSRPIAGTRPRGISPADDQRLEKELLADPKEKAEHLMLVDLGRNDLGRIARPGKVKVTSFMKVERYSHVMHLVSEVAAVLDSKYGVYDVLRACFPAGTVSGAPKVRAMEIIDELENLRRQAYAGCVGYFSFSGNLDTCITIRTIIIEGKAAYVQAGAGIVADSVGSREYQETVNKAKALLQAITQ
jgi:anthranilate synthase component 1